MSQQGDRVVVICRRCNFPVLARPLLAVARCDLADFGGGKARPAFLKRTKTLAVVGAGARFDLHVIIEITQMAHRRFTEGHFGRAGRILPVPAVAESPTMVFDELSESSLRY